MQCVSFHAQAVGIQIPPHYKTQTSDEDQAHTGQIDQPVIRIANQRGIRLKTPHQVKTRIAEGRYGMEDPVVYSFCQTKFRHKSKGQEHSACSFCQKRSFDDKLCQTYDAAQLQCIDAVPQKPPVRESHPFSHHQQDRDTDRHKAQTAHLDHEKNDQLSEQCPVLIRIHHRQPCHAGGAGGCKQCGQKICSSRIPAGYRKHQQARAAQNNQKKSHCNPLDTGETVPYIYKHGDTPCQNSVSGCFYYSISFFFCLPARMMKTFKFLLPVLGK
jgi:hypothetical protein